MTVVQKVTVVDPGFPSRVHQPPMCGRQPIIWPKDSRELYENERN